MVQGVLGAAGSSGAGRDFFRTAAENAWRDAGLTGELVTVTDLEVAYAAGTPAPDGVLLLSGTGALGARFDGGALRHRCDGYGWLLGDEGSAVWIAVRGLRAVLAALDGRGEPTTLVGAACAHFAIEPGMTGEDTAQALLEAGFSVPPAARGRLAPAISLAAEQKDPIAVRICAAAADRLLHTFDSVQPPPAAETVIAGSVLLNDGPVSRAVRAGLLARTGAEPRPARDGAGGAAVLAVARFTGAPVPPVVHTRLTGSPSPAADVPVTSTGLPGSRHTLVEGGSLGGPGAGDVAGGSARVDHRAQPGRAGEQVDPVAGAIHPPGEGRLLPGLDEHGHRRPDRVEDALVGNLHFDPRTQLIDELVEGRREVRLAELHAGQVQRRHPVTPAVVEPRAADQLERPGGATSFGERRHALEHAGAGIDDSAVRRRHVRARQHPGHVGVPGEQASVPPRAGNHRQVHFPARVGRKELSVVEAGQFADGHAVLLDDLETAHAGGEPVGHHRAVRAPADRIRTIQDQVAQAEPGGRGHRVVQRVDVGVEARAHVLDVEDHRLHRGGGEHLRPPGLRGAVGVVDGQPGTGVGAGALAATGLGGSAEPVLGAEDPADGDAVGVHPVDQVAIFAVHRGRVGDDADALALDGGPPGGGELVHPGPHREAGEQPGLCV